MKPRAGIWLTVLLLAMWGSSGCFVMPRRSTNVRSVDVLLARLIEDCEQSQNARPGPWSPHAAYFVLPVSVDAILTKGRQALPTLRELQRSDSHSLLDRVVAAMCLTLIEAPHVEKDAEFVVRGVRMASYAYIPVETQASPSRSSETDR